MITHRISTDSDIGAVLIGNKDWTYAVSNRRGDGTTKVRVFDINDTEFTEYEKSHRLNYISSVQGTFNIYSYDCAFSGGLKDEDVVCTLSGRYGVYNSEGLVVFVKWRD